MERGWRKFYFFSTIFIVRLAPSVLHGKTDLCILPRFFHREKHWLGASFIFSTILIVRLAPSVLHGKTGLQIQPMNHP